jgi:hypothetical protein
MILITPKTLPLQKEIETTKILKKSITLVLQETKNKINYFDWKYIQ